tara:strand:- start:7 stop:1050 length:1044 start_codon:yes stop_codon:yes gene_type:complete
MAYTTIDNPGEYFNTVLYTGNNGAQTVTGVGFQPDWVWIKDRDGTERHCLTDSVRGVLKELRSNETAAESDRSSYGGVSAFNSDGFVLVHDDGYNDNNSLQVSWNWKAGTSFTNDASSTGVGSIDSAGSVSTDAGFSILTWTVPASGSATVAHGLGKVPKMIISKSRSNATDWEVYHHKTGNANTNQLNTTAAANDNNAYNDTDPTSSVFSVTAPGFGANRTMVSYCFAEVKGYSKFGSYASNSNADGPFVYLGFRPALVIVKCTTTTESWGLVDTKRAPINLATVAVLNANTNGAEGGAEIDLLSNGFKCTAVSGQFNKSGSHSYIFMAFAESPFVNSSKIPNNAR